MQLVLHQLHSQVPGVAGHLLHHLPSVARSRSRVVCPTPRPLESDDVVETETDAETEAL